MNEQAIMNTEDTQIPTSDEHLTVPPSEQHRSTVPIRPSSGKPNIFLLVFVLILLAGGLLGAMLLTGKGTELRSRATSTGPKLSLIPANKSLPVGQQFTFTISLNTQADTVSAVQLEMSYDQTALDNVTFINGSILPVVLKAPTVANGKVRVAVGVNPQSPYKGTGVLGTLRVRGKSAKQSTIAFTNNTMTASLGKTTNSLASKAGSTVTVTSTNNPTNTPTQPPGPTNTPTPGSSPTPSPTPTPGPSPTPSPTLAPGEPTPTPTPIPEGDDYDGEEPPAPTPTGSGNVFQNWWGGLFGPSPTPTPMPEPTPPPTAEETVGYAIINGMCFAVTEAPSDDELYPTLADCIGALNMQVAEGGIPTPTPIESGPKTEKLPFFLRWIQNIANAISRLFSRGK